MTYFNFSRKSWAFVLAMLLARLTHAAPLIDFESEPVLYSETEAHTRISELQQRIDRKDLSLAFNEPGGYLVSLLKELAVPVSSQSLVFSKTGAQRAISGPRSPRAIYFSDDVYVGYVPGGELEAISLDAKLGLVFYRSENRAESPARFERQVSACMTCHASVRTRNVPGLQIRSVFVDPRGEPVIAAGSFRTDQSTPLAQRWAGWYVTGTHGDMPHLGNFQLPAQGRPKGEVKNPYLNLTDLTGLVELAAYPAPHSDIVALMVLEHQIDAQNLLSRTHYAWQIAHHQQGDRSTWTEECETLLKHFLFCKEAALTSPVIGSSTFTADFEARGPSDSGKRSLRTFDLRKRLFAFPCSYMIYSSGFDSLSPEVKRHFYARLQEILSGDEASPEFTHLTTSDRRAIREILLATKPDLAEVWTQNGRK